MRRIAVWLLVLAAAAVLAGSALADEARQPLRRPGGPGAGGPPGGFRLGTVLPPFMRSQLNLTAEQEKEIADLEKDVRSRLDKILTDEQKKQLESMRPPRGPRPGGPPGEEGPPGGVRPPRPLPPPGGATPPGERPTPPQPPQRQ